MVGGERVPFEAGGGVGSAEPVDRDGPLPSNRGLMVVSCLMLGALLALFGPAWEERCHKEGDIGVSVSRDTPLPIGYPSSFNTIHPPADASLAWTDIDLLDDELNRRDGYKLFLPGFAITSVVWASALIGLSAIGSKLVPSPPVSLGHAVLISATLTVLVSFSALVVAAAAGGSVIDVVGFHSASGHNQPLWVDTCSGEGLRFFDWPWGRP